MHSRTERVRQLRLQKNCRWASHGLQTPNADVARPGLGSFMLETSQDFWGWQTRHEHCAGLGRVRAAGIR
jgi:hypothetical protein